MPISKRIMTSLASEIFRRKAHFVCYQFEDAVIITAPLVMTQTFNKYGKRIRQSELYTHPNKKKYLLVRSENERLLSAYNKKILGVDTDWRKTLLLHSTRLTPQMSFAQFMRKLIENRKRNLFIDRHFIPLKELYSELTIQTQKTSIKDFIRLYPNLKNARVKSTNDVIGKSKKNELDEYEQNLISEYLTLW